MAGTLKESGRSSRGTATRRSHRGHHGGHGQLPRQLTARFWDKSVTHAKRSISNQTPVFLEGSLVRGAVFVCRCFGSGSRRGDTVLVFRRRGVVCAFCFGDVLGGERGGGGYNTAPHNNLGVPWTFPEVQIKLFNHRIDLAVRGCALPITICIPCDLPTSTGQTFLR